ncbi:MAG TPA: RNase P subunit p30 family protein [Candidatus Nanoarchaeia archaeon]|nr:RNase P subunit p30 family protein [Candidatus Nanoarchaeia archaeon]
MIDIINFQWSGGKGLGFKKINNFSDFKIVKGGSISRNMEAVNSRKTDILIMAENIPSNDKTHHRNSGLNHLICKLAKENNVAIGFSFSNLLNSTNISRVLGRMKQNVRLCRKYKIRMMIGSFAENEFEMRTAKDLMAFGRVLGMTGSEVKKAMNFEKKKPSFLVLA